jgi:hypothetical protein
MSGDARVATLRMKALADGRPNMLLLEGSLVNSDMDMEYAGLDNSAILPGEYHLGDAYPNPFNPVTHIEFAIPESGMVKLAVYNMLGQQVRELVSQTMDAGHHVVRWDATNEGGLKVASGLYIYQIEVNGFTEAHKMVLLK